MSQPITPEDPVLLALDQCLAAQAEGLDWSPEDHRAAVGERWEEFRECAEILNSMEPLSELLLEGLDDEVIPETIGRFAVIRLLGAGGFSRVYLGIDPKLGRTVAIKCFTLAHASVGALRDWIATEARSLAQIDHVGVLRVHELIDDGDLQAVVTEYVPGPSLADVIGALRSQGGETVDPALVARGRHGAERLSSLRARARMVASLARALAACHGAGVLHRDLKPGNVLLTLGQEPKLIDFGLSHLLDSSQESAVTQQFFGSPGYLAPEQIEADQTGARASSDQFALGTILYELLCLKQPFREATRNETMQSNLRAEPTALRKLDASIPPELQWICQRAMERDAEDRYASSADLAADLEAFLEHRPIQAGPPSMIRKLRTVGRRHQGLLASLAMGAVLALAVTLVVQQRGRSRQRDQWQAELEGVEQQLQMDDDRVEFASLLGAVEDLRLHASRLPEVPESLTPLERQLSGRIHSILSGVTDQALRPLQRSNRRSAIADIYQSWGELLFRTRAIDPEMGLQWGSCRVARSGQAKLYRIGDGAYNQLEPVDSQEAVRTGYYRLVAPFGREQRETEFFVFPNQLTYDPELRPIPAWMEDHLRPVAPTPDQALAFHLKPGEGTFRIMDQDVTEDDFRRVLSQEQVDSLIKINKMRPPNPQAAPILTPSGLSSSWSHAQEFAQLSGGRLPNAAELWLAYHQGLLSTEDENATYWVNNPLPDDSRACVSSDYLEAATSDLDGLILVKRDGYPQNMRVRVVYPPAG